MMEFILDTLQHIARANTWYFDLLKVVPVFIFLKGTLRAMFNYRSVCEIAPNQRFNAKPIKLAKKAIIYFSLLITWFVFLLI